MEKIKIEDDCIILQPKKYSLFEMLSKITKETDIILSGMKMKQEAKKNGPESSFNQE